MIFLNGSQGCWGLVEQKGPSLAFISSGHTVEILPPRVKFLSAVYFGYISPGVFGHTTYTMQIKEEDSWKQEFSQEAGVALAVSGEFHDLGMVEGEADTGDHMQYAMRVGNTGSVTLVDVGEYTKIITGRWAEGLVFKNNRPW